MNLDACLLGKLHEGLLNEQTAFIRQQMNTHLEEAIFGVAVVRNALLGCECGEVLNVCEV